MVVEAFLVQTSLLEVLKICTGKFLPRELGDFATFSKAKGGAWIAEAWGGRPTVTGQGVEHASLRPEGLVSMSRAGL